MDPNIGKMHQVAELDTAESQRLRLERMLSGVAVEQKAAAATHVMAEAVPEAGLAAGELVPDNWPIFEIGELIPIKGFHFKLLRIEQEDGEDPDKIVLQFHGMTKAERRRRRKR